jgi:hypothetical protein
MFALQFMEVDVAQHQLGKAAATFALISALQLGAAPAYAARDLSAFGKGMGTFTGESTMTLFGGSRGVDNTLIGEKPRTDLSSENPQAVASVPEPAGWLMMLLGFGLLGAITRRGVPTPLEAQLRF